MRRLQGTAASAAVFIVLLIGCLGLVGWIGRLAFQNTCVEEKEQVIRQTAGEMIDEIEYGLRFGKSLDDYYGIDLVLDKLCALIPQKKEQGKKAQAALLDEKGKPMDASFWKDENRLPYTARILSPSFQEKLRETPDQDGEVLAFGRMRSMVFPVKGKEGERKGSILLIYDTAGFIPDSRQILPFVIPLAAVAAVIVVLTVCMRKSEMLKRRAHLFPVAAVMAGLVFQIILLFADYRSRYEAFMYENAREICENIGNKTEELLDRGLSPDQLDRMVPYFIEKAENNSVIWNIRVSHSYMDTAEVMERTDKDTLAAKAGDVDLLVTVNRRFITEQMGKISASFAALFIICSMFSYELIKLIDIMKLQRRKEGEALSEQAYLNSVSLHIKLFSFLTYTGIYASMPFAAVLMMSWNASVWGLSKEVSASLPLSIELAGILLFSFVVPKVCGNMRISLLAACSLVTLSLGNLGCLAASGPYTLIAMRCVCSLGFALFKYLMNSLVTAGGEQIGKNTALLNAGLLGGITVGGSLGAVLAGAKGYQFNYGVTALIAAVALAGFFVFLPLKEAQLRRRSVAQTAKKGGARLGRVLRDPAVLRVLLLGDVPLNIGLMYVVAFLPVYMEHIGQGGLAVSYAYLVNGFCGVYIGVFLVRALRRIGKKTQVVITMLLASAGILILSVPGGLIVVLASAALMGIFDGYGTPNVTSFFTDMPQVKKLDSAQMLTVFGIVGSAVQIACPLLYNLMIEGNGKTLRLAALGAVFVAVALLVVFFVPGGAEKGAGD